MTPVHHLRVTRPPVLTGNSVEEKREEIRCYFHKTFDLYEKLFDVITDDQAFFSRPEPLRHPLIFYFGHTAAFFINKMIFGKYIKDRINPKFESMFAIGVDEMSWDDLDTNHYDWPSVDEVRAYRAKARSVVDQFISDMPLSLPITQNDPAWLMLMGTEHERIHIETSSVIIRMLPLSQVSPNQLWAEYPKSGSAPANQLVSIKGAEVSLGKADKDQTFGWDNEFGKFEDSVQSFNAAKYLTSNQEFMEFVKDSGYQSENFWCDEGKQWLRDTGKTLPRFWSLEEGKYLQRNLLSTISLPLNWPVEVNYYEAKAFCVWKSNKTGKHIRLPLEKEWAVMRNKVSGDLTEWDTAPGNVNLEHYASSCPVDLFETDGIFDVVGNVWQWTETAIDGFENFAVHKLYDDFSVPTFDGRHLLFKGGSWISTGNEAQKSARYAFRKHFYQHAGFRYIEAEPITKEDQSTNIYESDELIAQYLEFHYGDEYFSVPNFPVACAQKCISFAGEGKKARALDLGCAVGRSSFELAKHYDHVTGIDFSARFVQEAARLQKDGKLAYSVRTEGDLEESKELTIERLEYESITDKLEFLQGDACNLKSIHSNFDLIFAGNLIDRLYNPKEFLAGIHNRIEDKGLFVITSPYTWLEEYTDKQNWLGARKIDDKVVTTFEAMKEVLEENFEFVDRSDVPFVIRETKRKYQHTVAEMTVWRKK